MRIGNEDLLTSGPADLSVDWNSPAIWLGHIVNFAIQLKFSGSPDGRFQLYGSSDQGNVNAQARTEQASGVTTWSPITGYFKDVSEAGSHMMEVVDCGYNWVRVSWVANAGTGTLDKARINVKGV